ncbi:MAG: hypothetical protein HUJ79_05510 [Firmicutes bacterium]|nr:hypothetical protein [Bacillota bacterium]
MINSTVIDIDKNECCERAMELFLDESGCGKEGAKFDRMRAEAFEIRNIIEPRIDVKGVYSTYDVFNLNGQILEVNGVQFTCTAFEQIAEESIEKVIFYAVTAGDYYLEDRPIMQQLYADIWGTSFTDAIRGIFMDQLKTEYIMSDSFGPGFYGMDVAEMQKMPRMVDFAALDMSVKESSIILPLKSCAGILFAVNEKYVPINNACQLCLGSKKTCTLCSIRNHVI